VRKNTTHRDGNVFGKWSIILSLKLVSMSHSCPRMTDHCDVITPPIEFKIIVFSPFVLHYINEVLWFSLLDTSIGLTLLRVAPDFPPVEFSLTHFVPSDLNFSLTDFPPVNCLVRWSYQHLIDKSKSLSTIHI
jgi:hypothetical protein